MLRAPLRWASRKNSSRLLGVFFLLGLVAVRAITTNTTHAHSFHSHAQQRTQLDVVDAAACIVTPDNYDVVTAMDECFLQLVD